MKVSLLQLKFRHVSEALAAAACQIGYLSTSLVYHSCMFQTLNTIKYRYCPVFLTVLSHTAALRTVQKLLYTMRSHTRDLRIIFFVRIESRIKSAVRFVSNRIFESNRPYHTQTVTVTQPNGLQAYRVRTGCYRPIIC